MQIKKWYLYNYIIKLLLNDKIDYIHRFVKKDVNNNLNFYKINKFYKSKIK